METIFIDIYKTSGRYDCNISAGNCCLLKRDSYVEKTNKSLQKALAPSLYEQENIKGKKWESQIILSIYV